MSIDAICAKLTEAELDELLDYVTERIAKAVIQELQEASHGKVDHERTKETAQ